LNREKEKKKKGDKKIILKTKIDRNFPLGFFKEKQSKVSFFFFFFFCFFHLVCSK